jgi:hypothetical protein
MVLFLVNGGVQYQYTFYGVDWCIIYFLRRGFSEMNCIILIFMVWIFWNDRCIIIISSNMFDFFLVLIFFYHIYIYLYIFHININIFILNIFNNSFN